MLRQTGASSHFSAKMLRIFLSLILCRLSIQSIGLVESAPVNNSPSDTLHPKTEGRRDENHQPQFKDNLKDIGRHGDVENYPPADTFDQVSSTGEDEFSPEFVPPLGDKIRTDTSFSQYLPQGVRQTIFEYDYDKGGEEMEESENPAPKYMVDLYNKFISDRYSHPMANIVRSFENTNQETSHGLTPFGNKTRVHTLMFNVTSVSRDEDMYLAELRLYTLVEADRNRYLGVDRTVSVYEITQSSAINDYSTGKIYHMISSKHIFGRYSGWETFTITDAVKRWVKSRMPNQLLEVHIDTVEGDEELASLDINTRPNREKGPLLVVFSNDKKRRNENKELHEMIAHEMEFIVNSYEEDISDISYYDEYEDEDVSENNVFKRDVPQQADDRSSMAHEPKTDEYLNEKNATVTTLNKNSNKNTTAFNNRKQYTKQMYEQMVSAQYDYDGVETSENDLVKVHRRSKRSKSGRKKRNICKRKPMYVNFEDINWHSWIIAPKGYQAYECSGKCYFPLSDHLTPTKHAIIQTLLHTNHPGKASKACCVPTKLDPISILYIDEQGVVTYKYKYDGMKVADCGCR